jgi:hypothetical protein
MAPDRNKGRDKPRKAARGEYEVACSPKEVGRPPPRKLLQRGLNESADGGGTAEAGHGDECKLERLDPLPREDRAG